MKWFKNISKNHPIMESIFNEFGYEGYGLACEILSEANNQGIWDLTLERLKNWLGIRAPKAKKLLPYYQIMLEDYRRIIQQSEHNTPVLSDNTPVLSDNMEVLSDNMEVLSDNMEVLSDNMEVLSDNTPVTTPSNPHGSIKEDKNRENREKEINTPPTPQGGADRFEEFWQLFPRHRRKEKKTCVDYWKKNKLDLIADSIIDGLKRYIKSEEWLKDGGKYVPYPIRFLRKERWNDEISPAENPQSTINYGFGDNGYSPHGDVSGIQSVRGNHVSTY